MKEIKEIRELLGLTQENLAKNVGIARSTLVAIERGDDMKFSVALKIAEFFKNYKKDNIKLAEAIHEALELISIHEAWLSDNSMKILSQYCHDNLSIS